MSRSALATFQIAHPAASNTQKAQDALDAAADLVVAWAPPPEPEPVDYDGKAQRAERMLAAFLYDTTGYISGESKGLDVLRKSSSYDAKAEGLRMMVKGIMGKYYVGLRPVGVVGPAPW